jgi:Asp/Glu/hydantoin racemase
MKIMVINQAPLTAKSKPNYDIEKITRQLTSYASPGTTIELGFPDNFAGASLKDAIGSQDALNGLHHVLEAPSIIAKIFWAAENGYDAVVSSNTFDPGVDGARLAVNIPVIGPLRATMHVALTLADRVGVTVPLKTHVPYTRRILRTYGLENFVTDIVPIDIYRNVQSRKDEIFEKTSALIRSMVDRGAEIIVPLGGALIPYVVDPDDLARETGVQVLNTKACSIAMAEMCVRFGFTQSALTYPKARLIGADFTAGFK